MVAAAWGGAADADIVALLIDAARASTATTRRVLDRLGEIRRPKVLVLNKIDSGQAREPAGAGCRPPTSAAGFAAHLHGLGADRRRLDDLHGHLAGAVPPGPWLYPEDQLSDLPLRQLAAEITREKLFLRLHQELP